MGQVYDDIERAVADTDSNYISTEEVKAKNGTKTKQNNKTTIEGVKYMEHQLKSVGEESLKSGFKIHKRKTKFLTNIDTTENI